MKHCECGCGQAVSNRWATGHHRRGTTFTLSDEAKQKMRLSKLGARNPRYGKPGTMLGKRVSASTRRKIRKARARQVITTEHRKKISDAMFRQWADGTRKREDTIWWRGGITPRNKQLRRTPAYKKWRKAVFERDNYTCQVCRQRGGELNADHIKPFALYPELRTVLDNGRTLCRACHLKTDTFALRYDTPYRKALAQS